MPNRLLMSLLLPLVLLICLTAGVSPAAADEDWFDRWYQAYQADRIADAERYIRLAIEDHKVSNPARVALDMRALATTLKTRDKYAEAAQALTEGLEWCRRHRGEDNVYGSMLSDLGSLAYALGNYADAERQFVASHKHLSRTLPESDYQVLMPVVFLASTYQMQGRYAEAEQLLTPRMRYLDPNDGATGPMRMLALQTFGSIARSQGRFDRAEYYFRETLLVALRLGGRNSTSAEAAANLANIYSQQGRPNDALPLYLDALKIQLAAFGPANSNVAGTLVNLGVCYDKLHQYDTALEKLQAALNVYRKVYAGDHFSTANCLLNIGVVHGHARRLPAAAYRESLEMTERLMGKDSPDVARVIMRYAQVLRDTGKYDEATPLLDRATAIRKQFGLDPMLSAVSTMVLAQVQWAQKNPDVALATLDQALQLAEQQRGLTAGAEVERAAMFGGFYEMFEQMVSWRVERGEVNDALQAIERWRARSFLEEMRVSNADLLAGYSANERTKIVARETELRERIARLEQQVRRIPNSANSPPEAKEQREELLAQISQAQDALYLHWRDTRNANPVYRNLISAQQEFAGIEELRELLPDDQALALVYLFGNKKSYLIAVTKATATVAPLTLSAEQAKELGVEPGNLDRERLVTILAGPKDGGVFQLLTKPKDDAQLTPRLHALYTLLIPAAERAAIAAGKVSQLLVLPDGPLALLPFEALVVDPESEDGKFLLDAGPPITYGPSTTVLSNLRRRVAKAAAATSPATSLVLTVGDADYGATAAVAQRSPLPLRTARSRFNLSPLPYTGMESQWVADVFTKSGLPATRLAAREATEANVRRSLAGRQIVHLACHGMSDDAYGNFFGALALTVGSETDPSDDGMLQLSEIYSLDLSACELAILSACMTNYGPGQSGEGVWALSRGFLVAGARRVVASNWLVDDQAGATLMSYFATYLARAGKDASQRDYAKSLHDAKKLIRKEPKWSHPFYWSGLVLVGPN